jgi:hypothetical protein
VMNRACGAENVFSDKEDHKRLVRSSQGRSSIFRFCDK